MKNNKVCSYCKKLRPASEFYIRQEKYLTAKCKKCSSMLWATYRDKQIKQRKLAGLCKQCGIPINKQEKYTKCAQCRLQERNRKHADIDKVNQAQRDYCQKIKKEVIKIYGGKCICCGETHIEFLTIDHINGGGTAHRKKLHGGGIKVYNWLRKNNFPKEFQVLCMNCNFAKGKFGYCPHKVG